MEVHCGTNDDVMLSGNGDDGVQIVVTFVEGRVDAVAVCRQQVLWSAPRSKQEVCAFLMAGSDDSRWDYILPPIKPIAPVRRIALVLEAIVFVRCGC